jgi:type II secretory pathway component GspD/PulD (secretin)
MAEDIPSATNAPGPLSPDSGAVALSLPTGGPSRGPFFLEAEGVPAADVVRSVGDWFGCCIVLSPSVASKFVTGRVVSYKLPQVLDALAVMLGESWRTLGEEGMYAFGGKGETQVRSLPTYGIPVGAIQQLIQSSVVQLGDRVLVSGEAQKLAELEVALGTLRNRPSIIMDVWMIDVAEGSVDRVNAWLDSLTIGAGYAAKTMMIGGLLDEFGNVISEPHLSTVKGPTANINASFLLALMEMDKSARVDLQAQVQLLSGSPCNLSSGEVQEDITYQTLPGATTSGNGQVVSSITRRTVGLNLTLRAVEAGTNWALTAKLEDSAFVGEKERRSSLEAERLVPSVGGYTLLASYTRKVVERSRKGVPLLMEIPGVRNLVSKRETNNVSRQVMVVVRPLPPGGEIQPQNVFK